MLRPRIIAHPQPGSSIWGQEGELGSPTAPLAYQAAPHQIKFTAMKSHTIGLRTSDQRARPTCHHGLGASPASAASSFVL
jgi:hypothetical protein